MTSNRAPCTVEVCVTTVASAADIWAIIADPDTYATWVAGTARSRGGAGEWPEVGASLRHRWGVWPVYFRDGTTVTGCSDRDRLDLDIRVGPLARVAGTIRLLPQPGGTRIVLRETVVGGLALRFGALTGRIQRWRNRRSVLALGRISVTGRPR